MRSYSSLGIELRRCAKENCLNSSITRTGILTSNNAAWRSTFGRSLIWYVPTSCYLHLLIYRPFQPGPDAFELVPGSKLVVTRTAYKSNKSDYSVNGRTSSYKDVQALLKGKDIDLDHNRFLILQVSPTPFAFL